MFCILLLTLAWLPPLLGMGRWVRIRLCLAELFGAALRDRSIDGLFGLFTVAVMAAILNFLVPLSGPVALSINLIGWGLLFWRRSDERTRLSRSDWALMSVVCLFVVLQTSRPVLTSDTGLYHLPATLWARQQSLPLGLCNLHGRLGFNSFWFPLAAAIWLPGCPLECTLCIEAILLILVGWFLADCARQTIARHGSGSPSGWFGVLCIYPWVYYGFISLPTQVVSLQTDLPAIVLTLMAFMLVLPRGPALPERAANPSKRIAVVVALFALTIKLSALPLLIGSVALALCGPARPRDKDDARDERGSKSYGGIRTGMAVGLVMIVWLFRGFWLSGCPLFPSLVARASFLSWVQPPDGIMDAWIKSFARDPAGTPETVRGNWSWLAPWARRNLALEPVKVLLVAAVIAVVLSIATPRIWRRSAFALWAAALIGAAFWFLTAPDPRFGYGYLYTLPAVPISLWLARLTERSAGAALLRRCLSVGICVAPFLRPGILPPLDSSAVLWKPVLPVIPLAQRHTDQGYAIYTPVGDASAWAGPLPNTPYFRRELLIEQSPSGAYRMFYYPKGFRLAPGRAAAQR